MRTSLFTNKLRPSLVSVILCWIVTIAQGQNLSNSLTKSPYYVVEQGPHHKVWQSVTWLTNNTDGSVSQKTRSYTELATGISYLKNGKWIDASDQIQLTADGAEATNSQHRVKFLGNVNSAGVVTTVTPDGKRLSTSILGLAFVDQSTGKSVLIAEIKDAYGQLLSSGNEILYPDAFTDVTADVLYQNSVHGIEQLVVLRSQLPDPGEWGMNRESTVLEVITEFLGDVPTPTAARDSSDAEQDDLLDFGVMKMPHGAAFLIGPEGNRVSVAKRWVTTADGRSCLLEQVQLVSAAAELEDLPPLPVGTAGVLKSPGSMVGQVANHTVIPRPRKSRSQPSSLHFARADIRPKGFAIDYQLLTSQTNFTFQSDTTYYVSGTVSLSGTNNVVEGLTVIKFNKSSSATISASSLTWKTAPYMPAVFTAKDDNSVGDEISGSTGNPAGKFYAATALNLSSATNNQTISNVRFTYLSNVLAGTSITLKDSQVVSCYSVLSSSSSQPKFFNVLIYQVNKVLPNTTGANLTAENVTCHFCTNFFGNTTGSVNLTNCLFACVTNWLCTTTLTNANAFLTSDSGLFQAVGGGLHYLNIASPYRNCGTTNLAASLALDLMSATTYPPMVYTNTLIVANTAFDPVAQRDVDTPDLGYHYPPLDYVFGSVHLTNSAEVNITNGAVIALFGTDNIECVGMAIDADGTTLLLQGAPNKRNWLTTYNTVQEQFVSGWNSPTSGMITDEWRSSGHASILMAWTDMSFIPSDPNGSIGEEVTLLYIRNSSLRLENCGFHGPGTPFFLGNLYMTNCLFERMSGIAIFPDWQIDEPPGATGPVLVNNLFYGGMISFDLRGLTNQGYVATIKNNQFDRQGVFNSWNLSNWGYSGGFNCYVTNYNRITPTYASDIVLPQPMAYETGPLGPYYQLTNSPLLNAGSTNADAVGFYHYTVLSSQLKETNSIVDIGYHYLATDFNGFPLDADGDGVSDYLEDVNGNGNAADDLTSWQAYNSPNGLTGTATLQVFTPLK